MRTRRTVLAAAAALMVLPALARSDEPAAPVDDDFLEFLGSADSDDPVWNEYMESGEVDEALQKTKATETDAAPEEEPQPKAKSQGDGQ